MLRILCIPISISSLGFRKWWGHRICDAVTAQARLTQSMAVSNCSLNPNLSLEHRSTKLHPTCRSHSPVSPANVKIYTGTAKRPVISGCVSGARHLISRQLQIHNPIVRTAALVFFILIERLFRSSWRRADPVVPRRIIGSGAAAVWGGRVLPHGIQSVRRVSCFTNHETSRRQGRTPCDRRLPEPWM
jgi:hypothetical protein